MEHLNYEVSLVPTVHVPLVLKEIEPLIERLDVRMADRYSKEDLVGYLLDGTLALWVVVEDDRIIAFVATRIVDFPQARCLSLQFAAGQDMKSISVPLLETFHYYARDMGCTEIEAMGRLGWARHLEQYGFRTTYVVAKKEI